MAINDAYWALGHKLNNLRTQKGYTLQEVADEVGFTAQFLSMVEKGRSGISLVNLQKLMAFYGSTIADLIEKNDTSERVVHLEQAKKLGYDIEGVEALLLINDPDKSKIEPIYFRIEPNACVDYHQHTGEEFVFMIEGVLQFSLIDPQTNVEEKYLLEKGDTLFHPSTLIHKCSNNSNKVACFLVICCPATF